MSDLQEILRAPRPTLAQTLRVLAQIAALFERHERRLDTLYERLLIVDELPDSAPFGALLRVRTGTVAQRATLYLGNGPNQPLTKLTPTQL